MLSAPRPVGVSVRVKKNQQANIEYKSAEKVLISYEIRTLLARCTKKDILLFCVIEGIFSFINQESR